MPLFHGRLSVIKGPDKEFVSKRREIKELKRRMSPVFEPIHTRQNERQSSAYPERRECQ
jgi:hypothetical protein